MTVKTELLMCGLKASEAHDRAAKWWNDIGRGMVPREFNIIKEERIKAGGLSAMLKFKSEEQDLPSGILRALPFMELTKQEKLSIINRWIENIFLPAEGKTPSAALAETKREMVIDCDNPMHPVNEPKSATFDGKDDVACSREAINAGWFLADTRDYCPLCATLVRARVAGGSVQ